MSLIEYFKEFALLGAEWVMWLLVGLSVAASRLGSASSTFLLPLIVASFGIRPALGLCVLTAAVGAVLCFAWAPETRNLSLRKIAQAD